MRETTASSTHCSKVVDEDPAARSVYTSVNSADQSVLRNVSNSYGVKQSVGGRNPATAWSVSLAKPPPAPSTCTHVKTARWTMGPTLGRRTYKSADTAAGTKTRSKTDFASLYQTIVTSPSESRSERPFRANKSFCRANLSTVSPRELAGHVSRVYRDGVS